MQPEIFKLGLTTEAVSFYLILDHLSETGMELSADNYLGCWNADKSLLDKSLEELVYHSVIRQTAAGVELLPVDMWRTAHPGA